MGRKTLAIGDRVVVYGNTNRSVGDTGSFLFGEVGTVVERHSNIDVCVNFDDDRFLLSGSWFHVKQCRRLVKKQKKQTVATFSVEKYEDGRLMLKLENKK